MWCDDQDGPSCTTLGVEGSIANRLRPYIWERAQFSGNYEKLKEQDQFETSSSPYLSDFLSATSAKSSEVRSAQQIRSPIPHHNNESIHRLAVSAAELANMAAKLQDTVSIFKNDLLSIRPSVSTNSSPGYPPYE
jgi:hypothetical protein